MAETNVNGEEQIDLSHKPDLSKPEEPEKEKNDNGIIDPVRFKQYTDEELEKFVKYTHPEKVVDDTTKVEYLTSCLQELKSMLQDLRRAEKDPMVAELLLRGLAPKIEYYNQTRDVGDYNRVIKLMKEVQYEINECASAPVFMNLAEQIFNDLKLEGIMLKKS